MEMVQDAEHTARGRLPTTRLEEDGMTVMEETPGATSRGRVEGKVAIVTGGGQVDGPGIGTGKAAATLLARHGARVVLVDREPERAEVTRKEIEAAGGQAVVVAGDVTNATDCEQFTATALKEFGRLDVLVNNVGHSLPGQVTDMSEELWGQMIDINLKSVFLVSKFAIPAMVESGGGSIVNISSIAALRASGGLSGYSAAKGGMISLSKDMAAAFGPKNIRVNVVVPGHVQTPRQLGKAHLYANLEDMYKMVNAVLPLGEVTRGSGWDIGYAVLFFASDEASWVTGQVLTVDGGSSATIPAVAMAGLQSRLQ
jgi:NAD(P)-dependent dehydrogenase (short-subunit alcohol dehydrogenase family)